MIKKIKYPVEINADVKADTIASKVDELIDILNRLGPDKTPKIEETKPTIDCPHKNTKITKSGSNLCLDCNKFVKKPTT